VGRQRTLNDYSKKKKKGIKNRHKEKGGEDPIIEGKEYRPDREEGKEKNIGKPLAKPEGGRRRVSASTKRSDAPKAKKVTEIQEKEDGRKKSRDHKSRERRRDNETSV